MGFPPVAQNAKPRINGKAFPTKKVYSTLTQAAALAKASSTVVKYVNEPFLGRTADGRVKGKKAEILAWLCMQTFLTYSFT